MNLLVSVICDTFYSLQGTGQLEEVQGLSIRKLLQAHQPKVTRPQVIRPQEPVRLRFTLRGFGGKSFRQSPSQSEDSALTLARASVSSLLSCATRDSSAGASAFSSEKVGRPCNDCAIVREGDAEDGRLPCHNARGFGMSTHTSRGKQAGAVCPGCTHKQNFSWVPDAQHAGSEPT